MFEEEKAVIIVNNYFFIIPNENHNEAFERAKDNAIAELKNQVRIIERMKLEEFKSKKGK